MTVTTKNIAYGGLSTPTYLSNININSGDQFERPIQHLILTNSVEFRGPSNFRWINLSEVRLVNLTKFTSSIHRWISHQNLPRPATPILTVNSSNLFKWSIQIANLDQFESICKVNLHEMRLITLTNWDYWPALYRGPYPLLLVGKLNDWARLSHAAKIVLYVGGIARKVTLSNCIEI